ncbi:HAMP domain-containing histidine kinase [Desulfovibrio aminophilus]|nr:HAMP domain-containing sensor histidine kinase [Desulfovibrio aminophilus]MCM0754644.1 HAMP domain-containing histidine kinase [Desulfovibrio aminophilus]
MGSFEAGNGSRTDATAVCGGDPGRERKILRRIHEKIDDYESYGFSRAEVRMFNVFFDLAQEFEDDGDFYAVCVLLPSVFFNLDTDLALLSDSGALRLRCSSGEPPRPGDGFPEVPRDLPRDTVEARGRLLLPVKINPSLRDLLPFEPAEDVIGVISLRPADGLGEKERLFFQKFANRVGYQHHNRLIRTRNREHLEFIKNLVEDIGHNVIVPNMYFRLFFNRLKGKIDGLEELAREMARDEETHPGLTGERRAKLEYLHSGILSQFNEIFRHYEQTSLFLETLLRRRHFQEGRYVLEKRVCNLRKQVIEPQLERYRPRLEERGVEIDLSLGGVPDREITLLADIGLLAQVYSNLFSNAVKYAREVERWGRGRSKWMAYGWQVLPGCFGTGRDGIKLNVFSSGPVIPAAEREHLFTPGFRAANVENEYGTGHGLYFVRQVVELHGGQVGYEPLPEGNNFYLVLPLEQAAKA